MENGKTMNKRFDKYVDKVRKFYRDDENFYHTIHHVIKMFEVFETYEKDFDKEFGKYDKEILFWSIAYHDCFYIPGYEFNEEISADIAFKEFNDACIRANILSTKLNLNLKNPFTNVVFPIVKILHDLDWFCFRDYFALISQEDKVIKEACEIGGYNIGDVIRNRFKFYEAIKDIDIFRTETLKHFNEEAKENIVCRIRDFKGITEYAKFL